MMPELLYAEPTVPPARFMSDTPLAAASGMSSLRLGSMLDGNVLKRPPLIENDKVTLVVSVGVNAANLAPQFELTPGATIEPPSGTARNFTFPQTYTVTSEDKKW